MELKPCNPGEVRLFLTRHGKTIFNEMHMAQGWSDAPLTLAGTEDAKRLGRGLKERGIHFRSAWAGELGRQRVTARLILDAMGQNDIPIETEDGLKEICFGSWEGKSEPERDKVFAKLLGVDENNPFAVYSKGLKPLCELYVQTDETGLAESYEQATARIPVALERIAKEAYARGGGDVLAVTSGMIAMTYFFDVLKIPRTESGGMGNLSTTILRYDGKTLSVDFPIGRMDFLAEE